MTPEEMRKCLYEKVDAMSEDELLQFMAVIYAMKLDDEEFSGFRQLLQKAHHESFRSVKPLGGAQ